MIERSQDSNNGWSALYFKGSNHGSPLTLGGRICGWPSVEYPASLNDEARILEEVRNAVNDKRKSATPIAAIVIEPTQQSTGYQVSNSFIKTLKSIASDNDSALVVDETSTGCFASATGHFWQFNGEADYVTFGKRTQAAGFFHSAEGIKLAGNENDIRLFQLIQQGIQESDLANRGKEASSKIMSQIDGLKGKVSGVTSARAAGTTVWLNTDSAKAQTALMVHLRSHGVLVSPNGQTGIVARPSLVFGVSQADELMHALKKMK